MKNKKKFLDGVPADMDLKGHRVFKKRPNQRTENMATHVGLGKQCYLRFISTYFLLSDLYFRVKREERKTIGVSDRIKKKRGGNATHLGSRNNTRPSAESRIHYMAAPRGDLMLFNVHSIPCDHICLFSIYCQIPQMYAQITNTVRKSYSIGLLNNQRFTNYLRYNIRQRIYVITLLVLIY